MSGRRSVSTGFFTSRRGLVALLALAGGGLTACEGSNASAPTESGTTTTIDEHLAKAPAIASAKLRVDGDNLVLSVTNLTDIAGTVEVGTNITNPTGIHLTPKAAEASIGPKQTIAISLAPSAIKGLHVVSDAWTDARVSYEVHLGDGRADGEPVSVFAEHGQEAAAHDTVSPTNVEGGPAMTMPAEAAAAPDGSFAEATTDTFRICFVHQLGFNGINETGLDILASRSGTVPAAGLRIGYFDTNQVHHSAFLDGDGCARLQRTVAGTWVFTIYLRSLDWPFVGQTMQAFSAPNVTPQKELAPIVIPTSGDPRPSGGTSGQPFAVQMGTGVSVDSGLQTSFAIAQNAIRQALKLGQVVVGQAQLNIKSQLGFTVSCGGQGDSIGGCSTGNDIFIGLQDSFSRFVTAHETGHWIEHNWAPNALSSDYTYCSDSGCTTPPNDGCLRSPDGTHNIGTIEWNSAAHIEGFADFIAMLAYNNPGGPGTDCKVVDFDRFSGGQGLTTRDCEAAGMSMSVRPSGSGSCFEWTNSNAFIQSGVEYDWAKMYWDLFTDGSPTLGSQPLVDYLTFESSVSSWARNNHWSRLLQTFNGTTAPMGKAFFVAAAGNVSNGTAH